MFLTSRRTAILGSLGSFLTLALPAAGARKRETTGQADLRRALRKLWRDAESICEERCHADGTSCVQQCYPVATEIARILKAVK